MAKFKTIAEAVEAAENNGIDEFTVKNHLGNVAGVVKRGDEWIHKPSGQTILVAITNGALEYGIEYALVGEDESLPENRLGAWLGGAG